MMVHKTGLTEKQYSMPIKTSTDTDNTTFKYKKQPHSYYVECGCFSYFSLAAHNESPLLFRQHITNATHCFNQRLCRFQDFTQTQNVHVNGTLLNHDVITPDFIKQLAT